jgi:hypothetical protein
MKLPGSLIANACLRYLGPRVLCGQSSAVSYRAFKQEISTLSSQRSMLLRDYLSRSRELRYCITVNLPIHT